MLHELIFRGASFKTTNPVAKRQFVQSAKAVANSTSALVKEIKALDNEYSEENRRRCAEATRPLLGKWRKTLFPSCPSGHFHAFSALFQMLLKICASTPALASLWPSRPKYPRRPERPKNRSSEPAIASSTVPAQLFRPPRIWLSCQRIRPRGNNLPSVPETFRIPWSSWSWTSGGIRVLFYRAFSLI